MSTDHISHESLSRLFRSKDGLAHFIAEDEHVRQCPRCSELLQALQATLALGGKIPPKPSSAHPSYDKISKTFLKTYDNSLTRAEATEFTAHLQSCALCYEVLATVVEQSLAAVPADVEKKLAGHSNINLSGFVLEKYPARTPSPSVQPVPKKTITWIDKLLDFVPVPVPVVVILALVLMLGVPSGVYVVMNYQQDSIWQQYVYDDQVPYEYVSGTRSTRGEEHDTERLSDFDQLVRKFKSAMSHYVVRDYAGSIEVLSDNLPTVEALQQGDLDPEALASVRDHYFYLGVSHLGYARSESSGLSEQETQDHLEKATEYLTQSEELAVSHAMTKIDRDRFFLGLAYGFAGNKQQARIELKKLDQESPFRSQSEDLIKNWQ